METKTILQLSENGKNNKNVYIIRHNLDVTRLEEGIEILRKIVDMSILWGEGQR